MYECEVASDSSNNETLSLDVADSEISIKKVESPNTRTKSEMGVRQREHMELLSRCLNMVGHVSWTYSGFCAIYVGNQGSSQTIGEVQSS